MLGKPTNHCRAFTFTIISNSYTLIKSYLNSTHIKYNIAKQVSVLMNNSLNKNNLKYGIIYFSPLLQNIFSAL
jgi:hypothetical protein